MKTVSQPIPFESEKIQVLRVYPTEEEPFHSRSYVNDPFHENVAITGYDFTDVFVNQVLKEQSFILLEWDIAIQRIDLLRFIDYCLGKPDKPHVAPYQVISGEQPVWVHTRSDWSWVQKGQYSCAHFGFGCVYIPWEIAAAYRPNPMDSRLTDTNFSRWYFDAIGAYTPIHWDIPIVHLNL